MSVVYLFIIAVFINNFVVIQFLGICPFLGVSNKTSSAFGMGMAVTAVMALAVLVTYPLYVYVMVPLKIEYMEIIFFIFIIAALVQMLEKFLKKFVPALYNSLGIYLPLITTNCAVLGVAELVISGDIDVSGVLPMLDQSSLLASWAMTGIKNMNIGWAVLFAVFSGLGFTLAIILMSGIREKVDRYSNIPKCIKGFPISMMIACFMAMGFYVFTLL